MRRLSKRLSRKANRKEEGEYYVHSFQENEEAWISTKEGDYVPCVVLAQAGLLLTVQVTGRKKREQVDLRQRTVYPRNPDGVSAPDMTGLHHINDACILHNLELRSYADEPYTFMGNVLVSVNPLKEIPPPRGALGTRAAALQPHPFAIAEYAFQQMSFAADNRKKREEDLITNQSIVASGESGAGKTEASKRVLQHLVERTANDAKSDSLSAIDRRLLKSNEITESFGNAKTLRNDNSSRFGKFMKLHFSQLDTARGTPAAFEISAASVRTYLLERSRVSLHDKGERNYHVFYQLLAGANKSQRSALHLDKLKKTGFRYLAALKSAKQVDVLASETAKEMLKEDKRRFQELEGAMKEMGFAPDESDAIFRIVAGVLHLGNLGFVDEETEEGDVARPVESEAGYDALECAADLLGVEPSGLEELLLERSISTREGTIVVHRNANAASFTRDAVAKGIFSKLFDHVVGRINQGLDETGGAANVDELPFIGVLDIFGFESFAQNGFEQLLINFTNESLQSTFNRKVFEAELTLYEQEGLVIDESKMKVPAGNEAAMTLLAGRLKHPGTLDQAREDKDAVLVDLDLQCRELQPSDAKMLKAFHQKFGQHPNFPRPHPKNIHSNFMIKHYAGTVVYTVGSFVEKNNDALPKEINTMFAGSSSPVLQPIFAALAAAQSDGGGRRGRGGGGGNQSIVKQFRKQILELLETLEETACSFIRCVKPNTSMSRGSAKGWFSRSYVAHQLKHLSIPQTAMVLKSGLPTRIRYETLVDSYMSVLPKRATKRFKKGQAGSSKLFVSALFWAFQIEPGTFKMGHTKVFFKAGEIAALDRVMQRAALWANSSDPKVKKERDEVGWRFSRYYARLMWRRAMAKVIAQNVFLRLLATRRRAAIKLQSVVRMYVAHRKVAHLLSSQKERVAAEKREREAREARQLQRTKTIQLAEAEEVRAIEHALTQRQAASTKGGAGADSDGDDDNESDEELYDEEEEEKDEDPGAASDSDREETEEERMARNIREIENDAEEATEKEVARLEAEGEEVTTEQREEIYKKFEDTFVAEMAKYEAMRKQNEAIRADIVNAIKEGIEATGSLSKRMLVQMRGHGIAITKWIVGKVHEHHGEALEKSVPTVHRYLTRLKDKLEEDAWHVQEMTQSPVTQRAVERVESRLAERERDGESDNVLQRQQTMTGTSFKVNAAEIEHPAESAKAQLDNLHRLVKEGKIGPDELLQMAMDLGKVLDRRSSRTHSNQSDFEPGIPVICEFCDEPGNTADGPLCKKCHETLFVPPEKEGEAFLPPSRVLEQWAGPPLQFKGGEFFIRMQSETKRTNDYVGRNVFLFECGWERPRQANERRRVFTRWVVELTDEELGELDLLLTRNRSKIFKKLQYPPFPHPRGLAPKKKNKAKGSRYGKIKRALLRPGRKGSSAINLQRKGSVATEASLASSVSETSSRQLRGGRVSLEQYVQQCQEWLEAVVQAAADAATGSAADNPVFKYALDSVFDVSAYVQARKVREMTQEG